MKGLKYFYLGSWLITSTLFSFFLDDTILKLVYRMMFTGGLISFAYGIHISLIED